MKDTLNEAFFRRTASLLSDIHPQFNAEVFLQHALAGLDSLELMDRVTRTATAFDAALPISYVDQLTVLKAYAPKMENSFGCVWPCAHVAIKGLETPQVSLEALKVLTQYGSAEFAIRPFLKADLLGTLKVMESWSLDSNEHVRRLASEGCRPRLPWGGNINELIKDPTPTLNILTTLAKDSSLYVRKSVANHLNDITKDHPATVLALIETWDKDNVHTQWIIKHALRTLVKKGDNSALTFLGVGAKPELTAKLTVRPETVKLGEPISLVATLTSTATKEQDLVVDYIIYYVKSSGAPFKKVFKWKTLTLNARSMERINKTQLIVDFSTRKHYAGVHKVALQVNGVIVAETAFTLHLS